MTQNLISPVGSLPLKTNPIKSDSINQISISKSDIQSPVNLPSQQAVSHFNNLMQKVDSPVQKKIEKSITSSVDSNLNTVDQFRSKFREAYENKPVINEDDYKNMQPDIRNLLVNNMKQSVMNLELTLLSLSYKGASDARKSVEQGTKTLIQG